MGGSFLASKGTRGGLQNAIQFALMCGCTHWINTIKKQDLIFGQLFSRKQPRSPPPCQMGLVLGN